MARHCCQRFRRPNLSAAATQSRTPPRAASIGQPAGRLVQQAGREAKRNEGLQQL
jgi:hypothetical protein